MPSRPQDGAKPKKPKASPAAAPKTAPGKKTAPKTAAKPKSKTGTKKQTAQRRSRAVAKPPARPVYLRPDGRPYPPAGIARAEAVRVFGELYVKHHKDKWAGQPFILEEWQWRDIFLPIYGTLNRHGRRKFRQVLIGLPRWNGKSEGTALMVLYHLFVERVQGGEAYVVATTKGQASIIFNTVKRMIMASPELRAACDIYKTEIWVKDTGCVFKALPHDADTAQGFHPSLCIVDEVHVHKNRNLISAMLSGMIGRDEGLLVLITTAGAERQGVLWEIREEWKKNPNAYVHWMGAKDGDDITDPAVWRRANPASWISDEQLMLAYTSSTTSDFMRYHLNLTPVQANANRAFRADEWARCKRPPIIDEEAPCYVCVDGANKGDCFAVEVDTPDAEGFHHIQSYIFDEPDPATGYYDLDEIEELLVRIWNTQTVERMALDPSRLLLLMQRLQNKYGIPVEEFPQENRRMCPASATLRELIRKGKIRAGKHTALEHHILNAVELDRAPVGWRIGRVSKSDKIDGAIALAMAVYLAEADQGGPASFASTGGVWTIPLG